MTPRRIVSLVPSITELVCWLGRGEALVGRTRYCVEPASALRTVPKVGGTKNPDLARVVSLAPDLVIANREENRREDVEALLADGLDVLLTDPDTVAGALTTIEQLGRILACETRAAELIEETRGLLGPPAPSRPRVFVAVWWEPLLGLGGEAYGSDLVECAGGVNVLRGTPRYPEVTLEAVAALDPGLVLLPDEPYRFRDRHRAAFATIAPARVIDGKLLWWYGPRMPAALRELRALFAAVPPTG